MNLFELLAECSVAFSGFAAVYTGVRGSTGPRGAFRAWSTVGLGFLAFLMSLAPLLLRELSIEGQTIWRVSSVFGVVAMSGLTSTILKMSRRLSTLGHAPQSGLAIRLGFSTPFLVLFVLLVNALGYPWAPGPFLYGLGIVLTLLGGVIAFMLTFWLPLRAVWEEDVR